MRLVFGPQLLVYNWTGVPWSSRYARTDAPKVCDLREEQVLALLLSPYNLAFGSMPFKAWHTALLSMQERL